MSYADFTMKRIQDEFNLELIEKWGFFSEIARVSISAYFAETLAENIPIAVSINTEKAKSELIIANVLVEIRKQLERKINFFSGVEFNIDKDKGLNGYCDFIVSLSPEQLFIKSPVIALVEAKNENLMSGLAQCLAEMVAAKIFNEQEGKPLAAVYGAVTSGILWKFLKLTGNSVYIDLKDYSLEDNPEKVIGILISMLKQNT